MLDRFGPWSSALLDEGAPHLDSFWKRRVERLAAVRAARPRPSRHDACGLVFVALALLGVPTVHLAAARPTRPAAVAAPPTAPQAQTAPEAKPAGPALAGIVRDPAGNPVDGATVVAGSFSIRPNHLVATTGADGRFAFVAPAAGEKSLNYVAASKEGLAPASRMLGFPGTLPPGRDVVLTLPEAEPFVGTIRDRAGAPIGGARVWARGILGRGGRDDFHPVFDTVLQGSPLAGLYFVTTDARGEFRFPAVPAPGRLKVAASAPGMGDLSTEIPQDPEFEAGYITGAATNPATLIMDAEARVEGRIVTRMPGVSVAGVRVGLQSTNHTIGAWRDVVTDAEGRFEMDRLPPGGVNLFPFDHPEVGPWTYEAVDDLKLEPGVIRSVTIELIEGVLVEGVVVDAAGAPVPGLGVGMYGPARPRSGAAILSTKSDEQGRYRLRLPPGNTIFYVYEEAGGGGVNATIPRDAKTFTLPPLELRDQRR